MSVTAIQFWQQLDATGLIPADASRELAVEMAGDLAPEQMLDPAVVANWLVKHKHLTAYQAKVALGQRQGPLRCGSYFVSTDVADSSLPNWYRVKHEATEGDYWLLALPESLLQSGELLANPPSMQLARAHAAVQDPSLCALSEPQFSDGYLCIASNQWSGRSLASTMQGVSMPVSTAKSIVIQAAMALDRLHDAKLVHGDIGLHTIWWDGDQAVSLARDPLFLPSNPLNGDHRISVVQSVGNSRMLYAAPEFTVPGQMPTVATDLYALGCVWYELLTGKPLIEGDSAQTILKSILTSPRKSLALEGWDKQSQRLLDHLLAKNPSSRFASARQFLQAMQAAKSPVPAKAASDAVTGKSQTETKLAPIPTKVQTIAQTSSTESKRNAWQEEPQTKSLEVPLAPVAAQVANVEKPPLPKGTIDTPQQSRVSPKPVPPSSPAKPQAVARPDQAAPVARNAKSPTPKALESKATATNPADAKLPMRNEPMVKPEADVSQTVVDEPPKKIDEAKLSEQTPSSVQPIVIDASSSNPTKSAELAKPSHATIKLESSGKPLAQKNALRKPLAKKKKKPVWFLPVAAGGSILLVGVLAFALMSSKKTTVPVKPRVQSDVPADSTAVNKANGTVEPPKAVEKPDPVASEFNLVVDDQLTLWAPPYVPDPIRLNLMPPGIQGVLYLNVNRLKASAGYTSIDEVLSPAYQPLKELIANRLPLDWTACNNIAIGLYPDDASDWPKIVIRAELAEPHNVSDVLEKYQFTTPAEELSFGKDRFARNSNANISVLFAVDPGDASKTKTLLIGEPKLIQSLVEVEGSIPALTRQLEILRTNSCTENAVTFFSSTSLLLSRGRAMLDYSLSGLVPFLRQTMQEDVAAIGISSNLENAWYGELRIVGKDAQSAPNLQSKLKEVISKLPDQAESALPTWSSNPYWSKVAFRFPQQLRAWLEHARTGVESEHAVMNFYLPSKAAPNLLFATWMAARQPLQISTVAATTPANTVKPLSMDEILKLPVTIGFDQESLEAGALEVADAFNASLNNPQSAIQIEIDGAALEKDGITRNQQIRDFRHENKPFREVLISLVRKANPVTTVKEPNEKDQKLVWIIKDEDARLIQVTTRTAAEASGAKLPEEFVISTK